MGREWDPRAGRADSGVGSVGSIRWAGGRLADDGSGGEGEEASYVWSGIMSREKASCGLSYSAIEGRGDDRAHLYVVRMGRALF